jgi:hypothetical protein
VHARPYGRPLTRALLVLGCALALPTAAAAAAGSGGGGLTGASGTSTGSTTTTTVATEPAAQPISTSGGGITLQTMSSALLRHQLSFTGRA